MKEMRDLSNPEEFKKHLYDMIDDNTGREILNGFMFDGKLFSLSTNAQINWSNLLNIPDALFPLPLTCKDESEYLLSLENRMNFYLTALAGKKTPLDNGRTKKQQVFSALSLEELKQIQSEL